MTGCRCTVYRDASAFQSRALLTRYPERKRQSGSDRGIPLKLPVTLKLSQAPITKLGLIPAPQSVALPVKFSRGRIGRARLRRAAGAKALLIGALRTAIVQILRGLRRFFRTHRATRSWAADYRLWEFGLTLCSLTVILSNFRVCWRI